MKFGIFTLAVVCAAVPCSAQSGNLSDWPKLIDQKRCDAAKTLCTNFVDSTNITEQAQAQKCLANVALCGHDIIQLEGDDAGGGNLHGGYTQEAVDEALAHLNLGIKLAPQDITIHKGRLYLLEVSGRYDEMIKALDESCSIYEGTDAPDTWLGYAPELMDLRQYNAGLEFMRVLDKHYPNNPDIIANIGGFLLYLKRTDESIPYLQKAVELAPQDSLNAWDLGRAYDYDGQIALADKWYQKSLSLPRDKDQENETPCLYAEFVEMKLDDRPRACTLEKQNCPADQQTACASPAKAPLSPAKNQ
jgi:tetratricopeptide (TPR) repeat protein